MTTHESRISEASSQRRPGLLLTLGLLEDRDDITHVWPTTSFQSLCILWPLVILVKICVGAIFLLAFRSTGFISVPTGAAGVTLAADLFILWDLKSSQLGRRPPHAQLRLLALGLLISSAAATFVFTIPPSVENGPTGIPTGFTMAFGVAAISLLVVAGQRLLALAQVAGAILALALLRLDPWLLLGTFALVAMATLIGFLQARFDYHARAEKEKVAARGKRAALLLAEYEQNGRGWFWETDRNGRLTYVSQPLSMTLGFDVAQLMGRPFIDLVAADEDGQTREGGRTLGFHLASNSAFTDIAVRAAFVSDERWWSVSGTPVTDNFGRFAGFRGIGVDLTEMKQSEAEVTRLARYDPLTGLSNRLQISRMLDAILVGDRHLQTCALMLIDLDRFKNVNDTLGHPAGDALLRQVGDRLERTIGAKGHVGRQGGDEFKILLPGMDAREALADIARAVIASLSQPYLIEGSQVVIGASIGIAVAPEDGTTSETLVRNADLALYAAKADGRGVWRFYRPAMHAIAEDRRQLEQDLREALAKGELCLLYQPVVCAATERISGFEALLRWIHPVRGPISPTSFIPIAEDAGLIEQLGEWVLRTACHECTTWPEHIRIAVNVSPIQFASPALRSQVMSALAAAQLAPERLELEITEGVFLNDCDATDMMFSNLKRLGVRLVLDDFGTGYSSLGYLKKAPFDKIKIDQSFVRGAAVPGSRNSAIVKAIVSLAEALTMDTTAEGAETHDELNLIRSLGCSHIQGHIYGEAMTAPEVRARLSGGDGTAVASGFKCNREQRKTMLRSTTIIHDGQAYPARVRNISSGGALVEGVWNVPAGTCIFIELAENFHMEAVARWSSAGRCGLQFVQAVDLRQVMPVRPTLRRAG